MSDLRHCVFLKDSFNYWCTTRPDVNSLKISPFPLKVGQNWRLLKNWVFLVGMCGFFLSVINKITRFIVRVAIQMISRRTWLDHVNITRKTLLRESQNLLLTGSLGTLRWNISYKIANINSSVSAGVIDSLYGQEHIMYGNDPIPSRAYDFANFHVSDRSWLHFIYEKQVCQSVVRGLSTPTLLTISHLLLIMSVMIWRVCCAQSRHILHCIKQRLHSTRIINKRSSYQTESTDSYTWTDYRTGLAARWHPTVYTMVQSHSEINSTLIPK